MTKLTLHAHMCAHMRVLRPLTQLHHQVKASQSQLPQDDPRPTKKTWVCT